MLPLPPEAILPAALRWWFWGCMRRGAYYWSYYYCCCYCGKIGLMSLSAVMPPLSPRLPLYGGGIPIISMPVLSKLRNMLLLPFLRRVLCPAALFLLALLRLDWILWRSIAVISSAFLNEDELLLWLFSMLPLL